MGTFTERLGQAFRRLPELPRGLALVWRAAPRLTTAWGLLLTVQGVLPALIVLLTRPMVDQLAAALGSDPAAVRSTAVLVAAMAALMALGEALRSAAGYIRAAQAEAVRDHVSALMHRQSMSVDMAFYDLPENFDHLHRARREAGIRPLALLESTGTVLQNGITLVAMANVLAGYSVWLPLILIASTVPAGIVVLRSTVRAHAWRRKTTEDERRTWYYEWLLTSRETAAETRLFDLGATFRSRFEALRRRLRIERLALAREQAWSEFLAGGAAFGVVGATLAWMLWRALEGQASLGDLALLYAAFNQGQGLARGLLENIGQILSNSLFLGDLFEFLALKPSVADASSAAIGSALAPTTTTDTVPGAIPDADRHEVAGPWSIQAPTLRFEGVTFAYPNTGRPVFTDFNLLLPGGRITVILGANGAGKSTLIKLLCRFYDPQAGRVTIDGEDIRGLPVAELRRRISVLFQTPIHFHATAAEAIALGDARAALRDAAVRAAAEAAGADALIARLPEGYATALGVSFDRGVDLSVGEWQRIALARACYRRAPLLVLDEPTSAMDPWAEAAWMARFRALAQDRTVLLITHRLSTARYADLVYVLDRGRIVESGTHAEMRHADGRYAALWEAADERSEDRSEDRGL
jgi:ATP-binding cassette subfamily B protein